MGFVSGGGLHDKGPEVMTSDDKDLEELNRRVEAITLKVSSTIFPANPVQ